MLINTFPAANMKSVIKFFTKNAVIKGTIILTLAGFLSRFAGFFYRVLATKCIGSVGIGLIQLVMPVIGISAALCSSGIQTAISKFAAAMNKKFSWLLSGLIISIPVSIIFSVFVWLKADFIARNIFLTPECSNLIKILCISVPFSSMHNCINGYYYGLKQSGIPATSQLLEQAVRIIFIGFYYYSFINTGNPVSVECALYGNIVGELSACILCLAALFLKKHKASLHNKTTFLKSLKCVVTNSKQIFTYSFPLTLNHLLMHILESGETILIPAVLIISGLEQKEALSLYGILTGMTLPLIMFPSAITNSMAVMLLPKISKSQSDNNISNIKHTINSSINLCMHMGIACSFLFFAYGGRLGSYLFNESMVEEFVKTLSFICPFIFLRTTLSSILNGLGKTSLTFISAIAGTSIRLFSLIIIVPVTGIRGYLISLLISQLVTCMILYIWLIKKYKISPHPVDNIIMPVSYSIISVFSSKIFLQLILRNLISSEAIVITSGGILAVIIYIMLSYSCIIGFTSNIDGA